MKRIAFACLTTFLSLGCQPNAEPGVVLDVLSPGPRVASGVPTPDNPTASPTPSTPSPDTLDLTPVPTGSPTDRVLWTGSEHWYGTTFSDDGSVLAFARNTTGLSSDLWVTNVLDGETRFISENVVAVFEPSAPLLSPNGQRILYRRTFAGGGGSWHDMGELWVWDWETGKSTLVNADTHRASYRFTPDGASVIFVATQAGILRHLDLETGDVIEIDSSLAAQGWAPANEQLRISADSRWVAYQKTGNRLALLDLDTLKVEIVADEGLIRSVEIDNEWLRWIEATPDGTEKRVVRRRHADAEKYAGAYGYYHEFGPDNRVAAYRDPNSTNHADLYVWDPTAGNEWFVDSQVLSNSVAWGKDGAVTYLKHTAPTANYAQSGQLWYKAPGQPAFQIAKQAIERSGWGGPIDPSGRYVVYRTQRCETGGSWVYDLEEGTTTAIAFGSCSIPVFTPDGQGAVLRGTHLAHVSFGGQTVALGSNPKAHLASPDGARTAQVVSGNKVLLADWLSGALRTVEGTKAALYAISDTHLVYRRTTPAELRLVELP